MTSCTTTLVRELPLEEQEKLSCIFCTRKEDDEYHFGKFYTNGNLSTHYNCLLFSSGLGEPNGDEKEEFLGYLEIDILRESKRGKRLRCSKCRKSGATVGCSVKACKKNYHFPCGSESGMLNQYFGSFDCFCVDHHPIQKPRKVRDRKATCTICYEQVSNPKPSYELLWAPCCKKNSWFHRDCIQKWAFSAGDHFFKCPMCSNDESFVEEMKKMGITIPEQDASWELEPFAFKEQYERHNQCDHPACSCPEGRTHDAEEMLWQLILCNSCGSKGLHIGCGRLEWENCDWDCEVCCQVVGKSSSPSPVNFSNTGSEAPSQSAALEQPRPGNEGQPSTSSVSDDEVEIIAVIPATSGSQSQQPDQKPSFSANGDRCPPRKVRIAKKRKLCKRGRTPVPSSSLSTMTCSTGPELDDNSLASCANKESPVGVPLESSPLECDEPVVAEAEAVADEDRSVGEATAVVEPLEATADLPPISPSQKDLTGDKIESTGPLNQVERPRRVLIVTSDGCQEMDGGQHLAIKMEKVESDNSIEMGSADCAEVDSCHQENKASVKSEEAKVDAKTSLKPTDPPLLVTEVAKLSYREMTIKIFSNCSNKKFFFEPIVMLDPKSVIIQSQELFQEDVVRFTIQMWTPEIRSKVLEHLRLKMNSEVDEDDVTVMPYDEVQLVYKPGSLHNSLNFFEDATPYRRLNEKLDFFVLCDSPATAKGLAENLRHSPEFVVKKWRLVLECRGLLLNSLMTDYEVTEIKKPIFQHLVSSFPADGPSLDSCPSNEMIEKLADCDKQIKDLQTQILGLNQTKSDYGREIKDLKSKMKALSDKVKNGAALTEEQFRAWKKKSTTVVPVFSVVGCTNPVGPKDETLCFSDSDIETKTKFGDVDLKTGIFTVYKPGNFQFNFIGLAYISDDSRAHHLELMIDGRSKATSYLYVNSSEGCQQILFSALVQLVPGQKVSIIRASGALYDTPEARATRFSCVFYG